jgi:hypothetical protein
MRFHIFPFLLILASCGGSGGSSSSGDNSSSGGNEASHAIKLGPIAGASVTVYRPDCKSAVYQTTTDGNGNYSIIPSQLQATLGANPPEILCVEASGGKDVDPNDDNIRGENEAIAMQGVIRGYVKTVDLISGSGTRVNLFGSAIADMLSVTDDVTIGRIEQVAAQLGVPDIDNDGKITISDVTRYEMGSMVNGEIALRSFYLRSIHEGNTADRNFFINTTDTSIAAIRPTFSSNTDKTITVTLNRYSRDGVIRYGNTIYNSLYNTYTRPFIAKENELIYLQECRPNNACYMLQAIQVNSAGTKFLEYSDTGGVDLASFYSNQTTRADLIKKVTEVKTKIDADTATIKTNTQTITTLNSEIQQINNENAAYEEELRSLGG